MRSSVIGCFIAVGCWIVLRGIGLVLTAFAVTPLVAAYPPAALVLLARVEELEDELKALETTAPHWSDYVRPCRRARI